SLVFASWRQTLDSLAGRLYRKGIKYVQIDGRVTGIDRHKYLNRFQTDPEVNVLIMSLDIGSVGLTVTAATRVHIVEPQWSPSIEDQATARAHRMGQTKTATVVRYITKSSVEQVCRPTEIPQEDLKSNRCRHTDNRRATGSEAQAREAVA
ncbi:P-loop containing nucleoside triphosphate hydrolase protein, partial [Lasiosphaeris hirsuta]